MPILQAIVHQKETGGRLIANGLGEWLVGSILYLTSEWLTPGLELITFGARISVEVQEPSRPARSPGTLRHHDPFRRKKWIQTWIRNLLADPPDQIAGWATSRRARPCGRSS